MLEISKQQIDNFHQLSLITENVIKQINNIFSFFESNFVVLDIENISCSQYDFSDIEYFKGFDVNAPLIKVTVHDLSYINQVCQIMIPLDFLALPESDLIDELTSRKQLADGIIKESNYQNSAIFQIYQGSLIIDQYVFTDSKGKKYYSNLM